MGKTDMKNVWMRDDFYLTDANFRERMEQEVEPFLAEHLEEGTIRSYDDTQLRYYALVNPEEQAAIVISHGFCEFFGKYRELSWYFYQAGYSVFFVEYRGLGHSQRQTEDLSKVHLKTDFREYVGDLYALTEQVAKKKSLTGRLFLFAHSMGGAIGTMFLEIHPGIFERAVLSSPMMEANYAGISPRIVAILMAVSRLLGWGEKWAPGQQAFDGERHYPDGCSDSPARYDYVLELRRRDSLAQTNGGTYGWGAGALKAASFIRRHAATVQIPVLLLQAGKDNLVMLPAQDAFVAASGHTDKILFPDALHEIMNSTDANIRRYYQEILRFYQKGPEADSL